MRQWAFFALIAVTVVNFWFHVAVAAGETGAAGTLAIISFALVVLGTWRACALSIWILDSHSKDELILGVLDRQRPYVCCRAHEKMLSWRASLYHQFRGTDRRFHI